MLALRTDSLDPCWNLALEETLFNSLEPGHPGWFLLWRNGPSIIVGRHQNTLEEINEDFIRAAKLPVVRRPTGGGAVYHDEGNINFSFLTWVDTKSPPGFADFLAPIVEALTDVGVAASFSSRNDITVDGRKISGSAQRRSGSRMLHHGTMMVDLDTGVLGRALTGNPDKYQSKGVSSHKSRVANLREFLPQSWSRETCMTRVMEAMTRRCASAKSALPPHLAGQVEELAESKYRAWEWNYGKSPEFTERRRQRFPWGALECRFNVKNGIITRCRLYGDFFTLNDIADLEKCLEGVPRAPEALAEALAGVPVEEWFVGARRGPLLDFLCQGTGRE
ncbi:MAG: lipoate--protein ligase [Desulfovibrionaceae bacterium]|nr:lipoate--protein ligase [Desulfovibrionaceae bacterium]